MQPDSIATTMENQESRKRAWQALFFSLVTIGLFLASRYSYLLFHTVAELFSVTIAACVFVVAWNSRTHINNNYLLLLGISYLFVASLDLLHALAYKGMEIIHGYDDNNLPPQIWLVSRALEAVSLVAAPFLLGRRLRVDLTLALYTVVTSLALLAIFQWEIFPVCFVEGTGLTTFKKTSEYFICLLLIVAMLLLYRNREKFDPVVQKLLIFSMAATIATELSFTFYTNLYGLSNLLGHYCKIVSYYFIYKAIVETGFIKPYNLLFRELKLRENELCLANEQLAHQAVRDPLTSIYNRIGFDDLLRKEIKRSARYHSPVSLIMLDVDHFKRVNDQYGHHAGDKVLMQLSRLISANMRDSDVFARWGGEEFVIMLPNTSLEDAELFTEKLRSVIEHLRFAYVGSLTCSFGVTALGPADTIDSLTIRADSALYSAKKLGRNLVVATASAPRPTVVTAAAPAA